MYARDMGMGSCGAIEVAAFGMMGDATNSSVWRRKKLHCMVVESGYIEDMSRLHNGDFVGAASVQKSVRRAQQLTRYALL